MARRENRLMSGWARARVAARPALLLPTDRPVVAAAGPDPDRVLLIGSGPAAGVGVSSHVDSLTGALARGVSERSGRGAVVESIGRPDLRLSEVPDLVAGAQLHRYDAVVVAAGMIEAITLTRPAVWRTALVATLAPLQDAAAGDTTMLLVGMPPVTSVGAGAGLRGALADRWASQLNRVTIAVAEQRDHVHVVGLRPPATRAALPTATWYAAWGEEISAALHRALSARPH